MLDLESGDPQVRLRAVQQIALQLSTPGFLEALRRHRLTALVYQPSPSLAGKRWGRPLLEAMRWGYLGRLAKYRAQAGNAQVLLKGLHDDGVEPLIWRVVMSATVSTMIRPRGPHAMGGLFP